MVPCRPLIHAHCTYLRTSIFIWALACLRLCPLMMLSPATAWLSLTWQQCWSCRNYLTVQLDFSLEMYLCNAIHLSKSFLRLIAHICHAALHCCVYLVGTVVQRFTHATILPTTPLPCLSQTSRLTFCCCVLLFFLLGCMWVVTDSCPTFFVFVV